MRLKEFEEAALRSHYSKKGLTEEQIDEVLPALGAVARVAGGALARGAAAAGRGIASAATAAGKAVAKGATTRGLARGVRKVAQTVGGADTDRDQSNDTPQDQELDRQIDQQVRPGKKIKIPAGQAKRPTNFKVVKSTDKDVEIENPMPKPGEPKKFVYKKDDLKQALKDISK